MHKEVLRAIDGIAVFPIISLVLFVLCFAGVVIWAARLDRRRLQHYASLPLADSKGDCRETADR